MLVSKSGDAWLDVAEFAAHVGIGERAARKAAALCFDGGAWKGNHLDVRQVAASGGPGGTAYQIRLSSVPCTSWASANRNIMPACTAATRPAAPVTANPGSGSDLESDGPLRAAIAAVQSRGNDWEWRYLIIQPALAHPPKSRLRAATVEVLASQAHRTSAGEDKHFGETTLRGWIRDYEQHGIGGLSRKRRADRGQRRCVVSSRWDDAATAAGISQIGLLRIAVKLRKRIRSLWKEGVPGWRKVQALATVHLVKLSKVAGIDLADVDMLTLCQIPRQVVERDKMYKLLAIHDKDAKLFFDKHQLRVTRDYSGVGPMDVVVGDVHHMDNIKRRENGRTYTPKGVAWYDVGTNRLFMTIVFVEEGQGVRQEHVVQSFIAMTQHPDWGMPRCLYLDNGSEYRKLGFIDDALKLARIGATQGFRVGFLDAEPEVADLYQTCRRAIRHSMAYNAPGKPGIEGAFGIWERTLAPMLPGWIGGNRMVKKTHNVGKEPHAFEGSDEEFTRSVGTLLEFYETLPQSGKLRGRSPRRALTDAVKQGWQRIDVDPDTLAAVFATEEMREVHCGEFDFRSDVWTSPKLPKLATGTKIKVRIPIVGSRERLPILLEDGSFFDIATKKAIHGVLDPEGIKDLNRRKRVQSKHLAVMRGHTEPVNLLDQVQAYTEMQPPAPIAASAGTIRLSETAEAIGKARRAASASEQPQVLPKRDPAEIRRRMLQRMAG